MENPFPESLLSAMSEQELRAISDRIALLRQKHLKLSQTQFASALKISQTYLSLLENYRKSSTVSVLMQISNIFKVNLDWLLYGDGEIFLPEGFTGESFLKITRIDALKNLKEAYSLKPSELRFISWYLELSSADRSAFTSALQSLFRIIPQK